MGKHDHPSLQFKVEAGRLVPAGPYEAEVVNTYRNGAEVTVTLNQKRSLPLMKKYWAVLRDVIANCKTPWNSPDEASDALKLALGVTDISKTVKGQWFIRPGSISFTSMDEQDFRDYFEKAMAVLAEVTGIDPDELRSRYNHIPEQVSSASPSPADEGDGADPAPNTPSTVATESEPAEAADQAEEASTEQASTPEASHGDEAGASSAVNPQTYAAMTECIDRLLGAATDTSGGDVEKRKEKVEKFAAAWCNELPDHTAFVDKFKDTALRIAEKPAERAKAEEYLKAKMPEVEA